MVVGLGVGISSVIVPVYISEVCPNEIRGGVVAAETLFIPIGQFVSNIVSLHFGSNWRLMLGIAAVPAMIQLVGMLFMPESQRWLAKYEYEEECLEVLDRIYYPPIVKNKKQLLDKEVQSI